MFIRTATLVSRRSAAERLCQRGHDVDGTSPSKPSSTVLQLPRAIPGSITVSPCDSGCPSLLLHVTEASQFYAGDRLLTITEARKLFATPSQNVSLYYETRGRRTSRASS